MHTHMSNNKSQPLPLYRRLNSKISEIKGSLITVFENGTNSHFGLYLSNALAKSNNFWLAHNSDNLLIYTLMSLLGKVTM